MTTETGYLTIPVPLDYNPEDSRPECTKQAHKEGAELIGEPEILSPKDVKWPPGYEPFANDPTIKVIRWTMTRERRTDA